MSFVAGNDLFYLKMKILFAKDKQFYIQRVSQLLYFKFSEKFVIFFNSQKNR